MGERRFCQLVVLGLLCCATLASRGHAEVKALVDDGGAKVAMVGIVGEIKKGDFDTFVSMASIVAQKSLARGLQRNGVPFVMVELNSPGGDVIEAEKIGRHIRSSFFGTRVKVREACASACVLILIAGVERAVPRGARIGIHRPYFDPVSFADLSAEEARAKYNTMIEGVRRYLMDMGAPETLYQAMIAAPSSSVRVLSNNEIAELGIRGANPAWDELGEANDIKRFGAERWEWIKKCQDRARNSKAAINCFAQAYKVYPEIDGPIPASPPVPTEDWIPALEPTGQETKP